MSPLPPLLLRGDCLDQLRRIPDGSVDSVVTDPPYGLEFMGKAWDKYTPLDFELWCAKWAAECLRILKPGGHMLAFGGSRTWHRLAAGIEDAGFEIRDSIAWLYGSGFPKSLDVSKAIDKRRHDIAEIYEVTAWVRATRDIAGLSNADIDAAFSVNGMGRHWTDVLPGGKQPAIPTLEQVPTLLDLLGVVESEIPERIAHLLLELNGRKGTPGAGWLAREVTGQHVEWTDRTNYALTSRDGQRRDIPATDAAREWQGWGTALKPAFEPVVVARKPLGEKTVAANVLAHGTGALNIDATRIGTETRVNGDASNVEGSGWGMRPNGGVREVSGRWPANVALDESQAAALDAQSGFSKSPPVGSVTKTRPRKSSSMAGGFDHDPAGMSNGHGDSGGASRFFYVAKAPKSERPVVDGTAHPTVKPLALMRWLCRLVTPPGGVVVDPFAGSGTTLEAAYLEGFEAIGVEMTPEYWPLVAARIERVTR